MIRRTTRSSAGISPDGPARPAAAAASSLTDEIAQLRDLDLAALHVRWRNHVGGDPPKHLPRFLLVRLIAFRLQEDVYGGLPEPAKKLLTSLSEPDGSSSIKTVPPVLAPAGWPPGTLLTREWRGELHRVMVLDDGFAWNGGAYKSLSEVARAITGTRWSGPKFFGISGSKTPVRPGAADQTAPGAGRGADRHSRAQNTVAPPPSKLRAAGVRRRPGGPS